VVGQGSQQSKLSLSCRGARVRVRNGNAGAGEKGKQGGAAGSRAGAGSHTKWKGPAALRVGTWELGVAEWAPGVGGRGGKTRESGEAKGKAAGPLGVAVCESGILQSRGGRGEWATGFAGFDPTESDLDRLREQTTDRKPRVICAARRA